MFVAGEVVEASVELVAEFAIQCGCKENRSVTTHALFLKAPWGHLSAINQHVLNHWFKSINWVHESRWYT